MAWYDSNILQNPAPRRYFDYLTNVGDLNIPFGENINIPLEGRTQDVTDVSEIAPTTSTQNVLAEGIANAARRNQFDFTQPFSTVVKGSGQPYLRDPSKTYDYSGYKLGNPEEGIAGLGREAWETAKLLGGHAGNQIANTLGDYTATYTPGVPQLGIKDVMNLYDEYDFKGKMGEGHGSPYNIDIDLPPDLLAQIKNYSDEETGTIDPSDPRFTQSGIGIISGLNKLFGPKIASYLKNKAITKGGQKIMGPKTKPPTKTPTPSGWHPGVGGGGGGGQQGRPDRGRSRGAGETGQIAGGHHFNLGGLARLLYGGLV